MRLTMTTLGPNALSASSGEVALDEYERPNTLPMGMISRVPIVGVNRISKSEPLLLDTGSGITTCPQAYRSSLHSFAPQTLPLMTDATGHAVSSTATRLVPYRSGNVRACVAYQVTNVDKTILSGDSVLEGGRDILLTRNLGCYLIPPEVTEKLRWIIQEAVASGSTTSVRRENGGFWIDAEFDDEQRDPEITIAQVTNSSGTRPRAVEVFEEAKPAAEVELGPGLPPAPTGVDGGGAMQPESDRADLEMSDVPLRCIVCRQQQRLGSLCVCCGCQEFACLATCVLVCRDSWDCIVTLCHNCSNGNLSIQQATALSVVDQDSGAPWPTLVDQKGPFAMYATSRVLSGLDLDMRMMWICG
jgi:hypothetical protein